MNNEFHINQLNRLLEKYHELRSSSQYNDLSDKPKIDRQSLITSSIAAIHRISGENSTYSKEIIKIQQLNPHLHTHTSDVLGVVSSLKDDIENGYLRTLVEIIHSNVFSDFLEMSTHLNETGYKDAAAVLAGSTLENHLKQLASKNGITLIDAKENAKKASNINIELTKADVYEKLDNKNVTAWLDLRNKAAHGNYDEYNSEQVKLFITSIKDFITRHKA
jgi:hypothetical protein